MLIINKPRVKFDKTVTRLEVEYSLNGIKEILWYEVDTKYSQYLTLERADAFLVALIFQAIKNGVDIEVLAPISERLYYTCNNYLVPLLVELHGHKSIKIICNEITSEKITNEGAVGTGLSCGIDSFSTIVDHLSNESTPLKYEITHFTFFNVGSHGDFGGEETRKLFKERALISKAYADEVQIDFIKVDSNISEVLELPFQQTHTLRSMSAVLLLQKLFSVYYYSSTVHLNDFKVTESDTAYFDVFSLNMLSTENIEIYSSCSTKTRVEKTRMVADYEPSHKHLNVCVTDKENCGKCFKCLRTLLTLEVLGELDKFESIFNLEAYFSKRNNYIAYIIAYKNTDPFANEIYNKMIASKFYIPQYSKIMSVPLKIRKTLIK